MKQRTIASLSISLVASLALTACGSDGKARASTTWAGTVCVSADSLRTVLSDAIIAAGNAGKLSSPAAMKEAIAASSGKVQKTIEELDSAFSSTDIVGTPLEAARNTMGKQLTQVFPLYDAIDNANAALDAAKDVAAGTKAVTALANSLAAGIGSVAGLNVAVAGFKTAKNDVVKKAFANAPECKKVK